MADFEKAFDTLEWNFILKTLETFNFGDNFKKLVYVLFNNVQSSVMDGGLMTNYFKISRGVRQGCPLSRREPLLVYSRSGAVSH